VLLVAGGWHEEAKLIWREQTGQPEQPHQTEFNWRTIRTINLILRARSWCSSSPYRLAINA